MVRPVLFWLRVVMLVIIKLGLGIIWSSLTHSLTDSGVGGCPWGRGRKKKPEDNQTGGKLED